MEIDPYLNCPILIGIPYEKWKELEAVMQTNEITRGQDVGTFASIICLGAIDGYIANAKKIAPNGL